MTTSAPIILRDVGYILHAPGLMALASVPICLWFDEGYALWPFVWTAVVSFGLGQGLYRLGRQAGETRLYHAMLIAALSWGLVPFLGALPFVTMAAQLAAVPHTAQTVLAFQQPWNALFEAFSGFTGTGLTMALHPSQLPHSLQWWRSFMEWVGGMGVIVLMLSIVRPGAGQQFLYYSEAREEKILPSVTSTVRTIWWMYLVYTAGSILLLRLAGMPWWHAVNHGMTGIATGGFSVTDQSLAAYDTTVRLVMVPIMLAGATSFALHYSVFSKRRWTDWWRDAQQRSLWFFAGFGTLLLLLENRWSQGEFLWVDTVFQWISALGTAGFQTVDLRTWSPAAQLLLSLGMLLGGAAGSTAGGLKQIRVLLLSKGIVWRFRHITLQPHELVHYEVNHKGLPETEAYRLVETAGVLALLWVGLFFVGLLTLLHMVPSQWTLSEVVVEVASAQGNVGLFTGITQPGLPWGGKLTLMLLMWMGRLEILPVLLLFASLLPRWQT